LPSQFAEQIQQLMGEDTFIRPRAFVQPVTSAVMQIPYLDVTTVQAASVSAFFGGMQAAWTAEAQHRAGCHGPPTLFARRFSTTGPKREAIECGVGTVGERGEKVQLAGRLLCMPTVTQSRGKSLRTP
jgi:hypothetical protein